MEDKMTDFDKQQFRLTINVQVTMAITFAMVMTVLLMLASGTQGEVIVTGAAATGAAFINLVRYAPGERQENAVSQ